MRKEVNPDEYMQDLEKFNQTLLSGKEDFYSHWNMEDITDAVYAHTQNSL